MADNLKGKPLYAWVLAAIVREQTPYLTIPSGFRKGPVTFINLPDGVEHNQGADTAALVEAADPIQPADESSQASRH